MVKCPKCHNEATRTPEYCWCKCGYLWEERHPPSCSLCHKPITCNDIETIYNGIKFRTHPGKCTEVITKQVQDNKERWESSNMLSEKLSSMVCPKCNQSSLMFVNDWTVVCNHCDEEFIPIFDIVGIK